MFVSTPWDPPDFADMFYRACQDTGIPAEEIPVAEALRREPMLNAAISRAFLVPDGSVETWEACQSLVDAGAEYGAETLLYHEVVDLLVANGRVSGAVAKNRINGEEVTILCDMVVNAAGAWGGRVAHLAGCDVTIYAGKGTMLAMNYRMVNTVINRCGPPDDGDILVPIGSVAVIGTTSVNVPDPDNYPIENWEVQRMLDEGERLVPAFKRFRPLRAWAGVRPLYQETGPRKTSEVLETSEVSSNLREVTRGYALLDHATRDGVEGMVTITGGKWTTYRLMAEQTVDLVCHKLGTHRPCRTADTPLPGHGERHFFRLGGRMAKLEKEELHDQLICECELVTRPQIEERLAANSRHILNDLRRDLRLGMGPCQGGFCAYRAAGIMNQRDRLSARETNKALVDFLQERWKGMTPVLWGQGLRQMGLDEGIYLGLLGLDKLPPGLSGVQEPRVGEVETEGDWLGGTHGSS
jgi:glycerol-3-phosphate dehydrogenase